MEKSDNDSFSYLIKNVEELTKVIILNNIDIDDGSDLINKILNSLFKKSKNERVHLLQVCFLFLMFYTEFVNKDLQNETSKIYEYIKSYGTKIYKTNHKIIDSVYIIIASLIDADFKTKTNEFIKSFDHMLTRNITIIQDDKRIDFDPYKTPIISEILSIFRPYFDFFGLYEKIKIQYKLQY
uniref:Uncharacterized protein n=1 Tax=viral metagenome TaxID=1070528 RepID=A0A6C0BDF2_9ZZZZ